MIQVTEGNAYQIGVTILKDKTVNIAVELHGSSCGLILYHKKNSEITKIPFDKKYQMGDLYCVNLNGFHPFDYNYNFFEDDKIIIDSYAKILMGNEIYGEAPKNMMASFYDTNYDWEEDRQLEIPFHESLLYLMHPRGFTKDQSSKVTNPGSFDGIIQKTDYLKELGITAIVLSPSYEFLEKEEVKLQERIPLAYQERRPSLNYWGYKKAYYFAPKSAYASPNADVCKLFKDMVKELHRNGLEVLMQFYFTRGESQIKILEVLHFWMMEYHVDGFQLLGDGIPVTVIATDPLLSRTKLLFYGFPVDEIYCNKTVNFINLAECNNVFTYDMRRFLKSDERTVQAAINHMKYVPKKLGCVHYMTEINGFTLADLVSYDRKHNEINGENNMDGNPYNASWNCGVEGPTRKKSILNLRLKQMKNAYALSLLAQSTPMLLMGDEFGNSQMGNNNAYGIDSEITWLNWNQLENNQELFTFVKRLISFRKKYSILHGKKECSMLDLNETGYPELSFHGEEAWKCMKDDLTRHFAMMYYDEEYFIYIAINMHWVKHDFALPKLPRGVKWERIFDTASLEEKQGKALSSSKKLSVNDRSIQVLLAKLNSKNRKEEQKHGEFSPKE